MTPEEIREHAEDIIRSHVENIELGSIVEILADSGEVDDAEIDTVANEVDDAICAATITVSWPDPS